MAKLDGVTHQAEPSKKLEDIRKNRTVLEKLSLMVRFDDIWLDNLS